MIAYRSADARFPFFWESADQPAARWHDDGEGPAQYLADSPDGAWAEFLRHEEIVDEAELTAVTRAIWAVEVAQEPAGAPRLPDATLVGDQDSYPACRAAARQLRAAGSTGLVAPSAAVRDSRVAPWHTRSGLRPGEPRDARVIVLFGPRPDAPGWLVASDARPAATLLSSVRHFGE